MDQDQEVKRGLGYLKTENGEGGPVEHKKKMDQGQEGDWRIFEI